MEHWCSLCGFNYEKQFKKFPGKLLFAELPDDWKCPVCGAPKRAFRESETK